MPITEWYGNEIKAAVLAASIAAVDETTQAAADEAEQDHWWRNRTDQLEEETIMEPARPDGRGVVGRFGTTRKRGFYGLFLELQRPFLRPVADRIFPTLAANLRKHFELINLK